MFQKKIWTDREVENPGGRIIKFADGNRESATVYRNEGTVLKEGDILNAPSFNDLENRIASAFEELDMDQDLTSITADLNAVKNHVLTAHARADASKTSASSVNGNVRINDSEVSVYTHPGSGAAAGSYGYNESKTLTGGDSFKIPYFAVSAQGHITGIEERTMTLSGQASSGSGTGEYASKTIYGDNFITFGARRSGNAIGEFSAALGQNVAASGSYSFAQGLTSIASGHYSHAEGNSGATNNYSHSEGMMSEASGECSHAEGSYCNASGQNSHAEGEGTTASGQNSHAEGTNVTALDYQHAEGHYNNTSLAKAGINSGTGTGTAFCIGNGTSSSKSNALRIDYNGKLWAKQAYSATGADYAELFEWQDGNPNAEDRRGYFVTMDGEHIRIAKSKDWILGIISANPCVLGNTDTEWQGQFLKDEFGSYIIDHTTETIRTKEFDKYGNVTEMEAEYPVQFYRINPEYNPNTPYIDRMQRKEWDAVGMLGVLAVRDDGTCMVNGFCECGDDGIATSSEHGYRVIKRVSDHMIKIVLK